VDVVGGAGQTRAIAADDRFECLVEAAVVGIGGGEAIARCRDAVAQPVEIDGNDAPVVDMRIFIYINFLLRRHRCHSISKTLRRKNLCVSLPHSPEKQSQPQFIGRQKSACRGSGGAGRDAA
jgi:hypothetical protein